MLHGWICETARDLNSVQVLFCEDCAIVKGKTDKLEVFQVEYTKIRKRKPCMYEGMYRAEKQ
jgi:hypothetical protein